MKVLSEEKSKVLAKQNGWSLAWAEGFVDGERCRRLGLKPSTSAHVGIDDFSLGFRAGYYDRPHARSRSHDRRFRAAG